MRLGGAPRALALVAAVSACIVAAPLEHGLAAVDPAANTPPTPDFGMRCAEQDGIVVSGYCAFDAGTGTWTVATPARESAALSALGHARAQEGLPPLRLPANWGALTPDQQQFVLVDLARVDRGLPPLVAMANDLNAIAMTGAKADADPAPAGPPWTRYLFASNWAGDGQPAVAMYGYLFLDGWGGSAADTPNVDCSGQAAPGCWGHRHNVLGDYGLTGLMGVATVAGGPGGTGSSSQTYSAYSGPPLAIGYTWADALVGGAAGGLGGVPAVNALWPFADMSPDPWAGGAAATLAQAGVVLGTGPATFSPDAAVTLQEMVTFLSRALSWPGLPTAAPAGSATWAAAAMGAAADRGLLPTGLAPDAPLTRVETARLVVRSLSLPPAAAAMPFNDLAGLGSDDLTALTTAVADGLLQGEGDGVLAPFGGLTRAQAVLMLQRAIFLQARSGQLAAVGADPVHAVEVSGGRELYAVGPLRLLAPGGGADPTAYWQGTGGAGEDALVRAAGAWWAGRGTWTPEALPSWASGAAAYGEARLMLWAAGHQGMGPALFGPTVSVIAYSDGVQELLPGASQWQPAPTEATTDPVRAVIDALSG